MGWWKRLREKLTRKTPKQKKNYNYNKLADDFRFVGELRPWMMMHGVEVIAFRMRRRNGRGGVGCFFAGPDREWLVSGYGTDVFSAAIDAKRKLAKLRRHGPG
jgi:hypothetical protein